MTANFSEDEKKAVNKFIKGVRISETTKNITKENFVSETVARANKIWIALNKELEKEPTFVHKSNTEKIDWLRSIDADFQQEFPIVCVYMLFYGQYRSEAFSKLLKKFKLDAENDSKTTEKVDKEDRWCQRQADYAKYLVMEIQGKNFSADLVRRIWYETYESTKKDFADFRNEYQKTKDKLANNEEQFKKERAQEMAKDLLSNKGKNVPKEDKKLLLEKLKYMVCNQRRENFARSFAELARKKSDDPELRSVVKKWSKVAPLWIAPITSADGTAMDTEDEKRLIKPMVIEHPVSDPTKECKLDDTSGTDINPSVPDEEHK
jgi:hypothetical protein